MKTPLTSDQIQSALVNLAKHAGKKVRMPVYNIAYDDIEYDLDISGPYYAKGTGKAYMILPLDEDITDKVEMESCSNFTIIEDSDWVQFDVYAGEGRPPEQFKLYLPDWKGVRDSAFLTYPPKANLLERFFYFLRHNPNVTLYTMPWGDESFNFPIQIGTDINGVSYISYDFMNVSGDCLLKDATFFLDSNGELCLTMPVDENYKEDVEDEDGQVNCTIYFPYWRGVTY